MKCLATLILSLLCVANSFASSDICFDSTYTRTTIEERSLLLNKTKTYLINEANDSIASLTKARKYFLYCTKDECIDFQNKFLSLLNEQFHTSKLIKAITHKSSVDRHRKTKKPKTVKNILQRIQNQTLKPSDVASFNLKGFSYSDEDKKKTLRLWINIFVRFVDSLPKNSKYKLVIDKTNNYFKQLSYDYLVLNPLLAFVTESDISNFKSLIGPIDRMINFNNEFLRQAKGYYTTHKNSYWSYLNLTNLDHEMGLVNFPKVIANVIDQSNLSSNDKAIYCSAWKDLKRQQIIRIRTSIGVGFGTALVCGVGVWSGVGTLPAAGFCSFAIADGIWGARRGLLDMRMKKSALYAGVDIFSDGTFSTGIMDPESSAQGVVQGHFVFWINMLGLVPIGRAISTASRSGRGGLFDLFKIPGSDLTVSTFEAASANMAYATLVIRGSEAIQNEFKEEISRMVWLALSMGS